MKGNQKTLLADIESVRQTATPLSEYRELDKSHGRKVERIVHVFDAFQGEKTMEWKNLTSYILVQRNKTEKGITSTEYAFFMSDLRLTAEEFHQGIRGHWGIENRLHWVKDAIHKEDKNGIRSGTGPVSASVFSSIAINIHRKNGNDSISEGQIKFRNNVRGLLGFCRS